MTDLNSVPWKFIGLLVMGFTVAIITEWMKDREKPQPKDDPQRGFEVLPSSLPPKAGSSPRS